MNEETTTIENTTQQEADNTPESVTESDNQESLFLDTEGADNDTDTDDEPELLLGKFKNVEDLTKSYEHLEQKLKERAPEWDVPSITEEMPFGYAYEEVFLEAGIEPMDPETNKERYEEFFNELRDQGFSQTQMETMVRTGGAWLNQQLAELGPDVDVKQEYEKMTELGITEKDAAAIGKWATANLDSEIYNKPLHKTAAGMAFLKQQMQKAKGPTPITDSPKSVVDVTEMETELDTLMRSPEYNNMSLTDNATRQKVRQLIKQIETSRKG